MDCLCTCMTHGQRLLFVLFFLCSVTDAAGIACMSGDVSLPVNLCVCMWLG